MRLRFFDKDFPRPTEEATMNPSAVLEAKLFQGSVHYFDGQHHHDLQGLTLVEVGKWTDVGSEDSPEDLIDTYHAAKTLELHANISWLPVSGQNERKYLLHNGFDEHGDIIPLTEAEAEKIIKAINIALQVMINSYRKTKKISKRIKNR